MSQHSFNNILATLFLFLAIILPTPLESVQPVKSTITQTPFDITQLVPTSSSTSMGDPSALQQSLAVTTDFTTTSILLGKHSQCKMYFKVIMFYNSFNLLCLLQATTKIILQSTKDTTRMPQSMSTTSTKSK